MQFPLSSTRAGRLRKALVLILALVASQSTRSYGIVRYPKFVGASVKPLMRDLQLAVRIVRSFTDFLQYVCFESLDVFRCPSLYPNQWRQAHTHEPLM